MNQLSQRSLSSLGATFVWQVRFGIFGYVCVCVCVFFFFFKSFWLYVIMMCVDFFYFILFLFLFFFRFGCMNILGLVLRFRKMLMAYIRGFSIVSPNTACQRLPSVLWKFGVQ